MRSRHYAAAITAFVLWGFFSFGLKPIHHYPSLDILFYRVFLCVGLMLFINVLFRRKVVSQTIRYFRLLPPVEKKKLSFQILTSSLLLAANWFFFIYVMNHISVKAASLAYLICPILTTVFAFVLLKEKLTRIQWIAVALSIASCIMLSRDSYRDILYSLIVAATYALYLVIQKRIGAIDRFLLLSLQLGITALILLPFYPAYSGPTPQETSFYAYIGIIAVLFTIIPMFLNLFALKKINSSTIGILMYINPIINFMLAIFYYGETITGIQVVSYTLILASIIIFNAKALGGKN